MDADQPAELALGPAIRKPELPDGTTDGRSADQLRIRRLTPGRRAHVGESGRMASSAAYPASPRLAFAPAELPIRPTGIARRGCLWPPGKVRIRAITKNGRTNERKKQERPPHRGEAFFRDGRAASVFDQIGPRPMRDLPRRAFQATTTITAPITATTIVVRLIPVM